MDTTTTSTSMKAFIENLPKAELHVHLEGTLEPEMLFYLAKRNAIIIPHDSVESLTAAYARAGSLKEFLELYYEGASVLCTEADFYDLTLAYLLQVYDQNVVRVELMFDPQTHTSRGVLFSHIIQGMHRAMQYCRDEYGMSISCIMCFRRELSEEEALATLQEALPYKDKIMGIGLDSFELNNEPRKFQSVFRKARELGFRLVSHAGEEGPPDYIYQALDVLQVDRIDHGIQCLQDDALVKRLAQQQIPLTLCPLSNVKLGVVDDIKNFPLLRMMEAGLLVTINSDDPAYFGGYVNANYEAITDALGLTRDDLRQLAKQSFQACFCTTEERERWIAMVDQYCDSYDLDMNERGGEIAS